MRDIVICQECKHRVPPRRPNERSYCDKHKVYLYEDNNEGYCIHGERKGGTRMKNEKRESDGEREEMVRFLLKCFNDRERIKPDSYLCLSCKHYKPRKGECKKIKGFLGEDFAHGNVYSAICPEYEPGKDWQWLKGKKQRQ